METSSAEAGVKLSGSIQKSCASAGPQRSMAQDAQALNKLMERIENTKSMGIDLFSLSQRRIMVTDTKTNTQ